MPTENIPAFKLNSQPHCAIFVKTEIKGTPIKTIIPILAILISLFNPEIPGKGLCPDNIQSGETDIVTNPQDPVPEKGQRKKLIFTEELTIGVEEGDENYMFRDSVSVIVDDSGCFYVMDWDRKRIQKYDPQGKYLFSPGNPNSVDTPILDLLCPPVTPNHYSPPHNRSGNDGWGRFSFPRQD